MKTTRFQLLSFFLLLTTATGLFAQTAETLPEVRSIRIQNWSVIKFIPGKLDSGQQVKLEIDNQKPIRDKASYTTYDRQSGHYLISNISGRIVFDASRFQIWNITVSNHTRLEGMLPNTSRMDIRVEQNSSANLHYRIDTLQVTAVQASVFTGSGSGKSDILHLRAGSGAYISNRHTDTTRILKCAASHMGSVDASQSPALLSFDTLWNSSIVNINAKEAYPVVLGNGSFSNPATNRQAGHEKTRIQTVYTYQYNNRYPSPYAPGERIPLKDFISGEADQCDIENYYSDLQQEKQKSGSFYVEDAIFFGKKKRSQPRFRGQWMGLEVKVPMWGLDNIPSNDPMGYDNLDLNFTQTFGIGWNVFQLSFGFNSPNWGFVTGAGFLWENYFFSYPNTYIEKQNNKLFVGRDESPEKRYIKSKLGVSYFRIPLLFEYTNSNGAWKSVHVSAGLIPSVLMCSWSKQVYREDGKRQHAKNKTDYYVNPFRLDLALYAGWGPLSIYFTYSPIDFFRSNKAPGITPFGFGFLIGCH